VPQDCEVAVCAKAEHLKMLPTQSDQLQRAEAAARKLFTSIQSASVAQLLQHPPPAALSEQQQDLLEVCSCSLLMVMSVSQVNDAAVPAEQVRCLQY
jgi:hypothetical protein